MVWTNLPLGNLPTLGTIIWCRFPMGGNPNIPGGEHHPVLVLGRNIDLEERTGRLVVAYGTGTLKEDTRGQLDLIIGADEYAAHGLEKPTRFDLANVKTCRLDLPWASEWFSKPRSKPDMLIGALQTGSMARLKAALAWRKANNRMAD